MESQNCTTSTNTAIPYDHTIKHTNSRRRTNGPGINQATKKRRNGKRGKVPQGYVLDAKKRISMYNKRKAGLEKKAMEIEVFTDAKVMLLIYNNESKWIDIYSSQIQDNQPRSNLFNLLKHQLLTIEAISNRMNKAIRVYHNTELKTPFGVLGSAKTTDLNVNDFGDYIIGGIGNGHIGIVNKPISNKRGRTRREERRQMENTEHIPMQIQPYINPQYIQHTDVNVDSFQGFEGHFAGLEELYEAINNIGATYYDYEHPGFNHAEPWMNFGQEDNQAIVLARNNHEIQHGGNDFASKLRSSMDYIISGIKAISDLQRETRLIVNNGNVSSQIVGIRFTKVDPV